MKKILLLSLTLFSTLASANCSFFIEGNLGSRDESNNGFYWEVENVMQNKGYARIYDKSKSNLVIEISSQLNKQAKRHFFTALKDAFDRDSETDYTIKYDRITNVKVKNSNGQELGTGTLETSGKTVDNLNDFIDAQAIESVKEAAILIMGVQECSN